MYHISKQYPSILYLILIVFSLGKLGSILEVNTYSIKVGYYLLHTLYVTLKCINIITEMSLSN